MSNLKNNFENVNRKKEVVQAYAQFMSEGVGIGKTILATHTFKPDFTKTKTGSIHPEHANKIFRLYANKLNDRIYGDINWQRKKQNGILIIRAEEKGKRGDQLHYHCLYSRLPDEITPDVMKEEWDNVARLTGIGRRAGFSKIEECRDKEKSENYISKNVYMAKGGQVDFIGPWAYRKEIAERWKDQLVNLSTQK